MNNRFAGRTALITGAGGGIGLSTVKKLSSEGAIVILADINEEALTTCVEYLEENNAKYHLLPGDLTDSSYCDALPNSAHAITGSLDLLINNAGFMRRGNILSATDEDLSLSLAINVEAIFRTCRSAIKLMKENGHGAIVNIASCWGIYPGPNHLVYCTSKAAVAAMTQCLGRDHAGDGIRVNAVCPNEVNTPMLRTGFEIRGLDADNAVAELNKSVPIGRIAEPEDIADAIAYLASDEARYICGCLLEINGAKPVY